MLIENFFFFEIYVFSVFSQRVAWPVSVKTNNLFEQPNQTRKRDKTVLKTFRPIERRKCKILLLEMSKHQQSTT